MTERMNILSETIDVNIKNAVVQIDMNAAPPQDETLRQYYFIEKCREFVKKQSEELGTAFICLLNMLWLSDERKRLRKINRYS